MTSLNVTSLVVMAGLPGSGKSTIAGALARRLGCTIASVDPVEAALWRAGVARDQPTGLAAYVVVEEIARQQLRVDRPVIIDAVNDVEPARQQWRSLAAETGSRLVFVEVTCSERTEHRRRLESRTRDILGFPEPTWNSVEARRDGFEAWTDDRLRLDSLDPLEVNVERALAALTL